MREAANSAVLKKRIDSYLWDDQSLALKHLRQLLSNYVTQFDGVAIVGGFVRDFARGGREAFQSDVDLVIDAPADDVAAFAESLHASRNRFGGYGFRDELWKIDFWALETTWAAKEGHTTVSTMTDVMKCTFFDCDAILYDLKTRRVSAPRGYYDRLRQKRIDINLRPNPSVEGNLLRAVRRLLCWNATPGPALSDFVGESLTPQSFTEIACTETRLNWTPVVSMFDDVETLRAHIFEPRYRARLSTSGGEQQMLPGI